MASDGVEPKVINIGALARDHLVIAKKYGEIPSHMFIRYGCVVIYCYTVDSDENSHCVTFFAKTFSRENVSTKKLDSITVPIPRSENGIRPHVRTVGEVKEWAVKVCNEHFLGLQYPKVKLMFDHYGVADTMGDDLHRLSDLNQSMGILSFIGVDRVLSSMRELKVLLDGTTFQWQCLCFYKNKKAPTDAIGSKAFVMNVTGARVLFDDNRLLVESVNTFCEGADARLFTPPEDPDDWMKLYSFVGDYLKGDA